MHPKKQIRQIADSILAFGFNSPVLVDGENQIVAGHGRVGAAKVAGLTEIPTICVTHMTEEEIRAYVIADNKLALNAVWDLGVLKLEIEELSFNSDFNLAVMGFETAELDQILHQPGESGGEEPVPAVDVSKPAVSRIGDLWRIGRHAVLCADATKPESYCQLLGDRRAQLVFTDPPYNVPINGHVSGLGKARHEEFAMASGEMDRGQFTQFLATVFGNLANHSTDGSIHYICMDWR